MTPPSGPGLAPGPALWYVKALRSQDPSPSGDVMHDDRRTHRRHDAFVPVHISDDEIRWSGLTSNISRTGALVWTDALVGVGQFVYFHLDRPGRGATVIGRVVRECDAETEDRWGTRQIAVRFRLPLPERINSLVDDLEIFDGRLNETPSTEIAIAEA